MPDVDIYDVSVAIPIAQTTSLIRILRKAFQHPDAANFPEARLAPDMKPLTFQVQQVSNQLSKSLMRLIGTEMEVQKDDETTVQQLIERAEKTLEMLKGIDRGSFKGVGTKAIPLPGGELMGREYVLGWVMPNVFFHVQTAYSILRMKGVPLGKDDYWNAFNEYFC